MKIGIDISQLAYEKTGVANYLKNLLENLLEVDTKNQYVLFFSSLRGVMPELNIKNENVTIKKFKFPQAFLNIIWNNLHILPIESLIGSVDVFISSDWTEPPVKNASKVTILYDLIVYKYPNETANSIVEVQKKKIAWVKKETERILCISESTKKDAIEILGIDASKLVVINAGV